MKESRWHMGKKEQDEPVSRYSGKLLFTTAAHKSYSQPTRWKADAIINVLSLLLWSPPMCVHSSPKNVSTVPVKPRHRPIIRRPLTAWMYADNRQTHIQSVTDVFYRRSQSNQWLFVSAPTFDLPQHPEVHTVHQSSGVLIAVLPQVRPVPSCHHNRGAPLTSQLGHPSVRKYKIWTFKFINVHTVFHCVVLSSSATFVFSKSQAFI